MWSNAAKTIYLRTYSRNDNGIRETWEQTVDRVIQGNTRNHQVSQKEKDLLKYFMMNRKALPAGRGLWFSGTKAHEHLGANALNNCTFLTCDKWEMIPMAMDLLMLGSGVGMSVEQQFIQQLPTIKPAKITHNLQKDAYFIVPDSREGWCGLLAKIFKAYFKSGKCFDYSTSCIRGAGELIKGFGGVSSGPLPLIKCVEKICGILNARIGQKARPIDMADILCCVAEMVVSGNVRRCLPEGTLIQTFDGLKKIESINTNDLVKTTEGYKKVEELIHQGKQKVIHISHQLGTLTCTPNHRVAILTSPDTYEFKQAQDIKKDDRLVFVKGSALNNKTNLPPWSYDKPLHSTTCKDIVIPDLNKDISWFLGYFHGNGYVYDNKKENGFNAYVMVSCPSHRPEIFKKTKELIEQFGVSTNIIYPSEKDDCYKIRSQSKQLAWYLSQFKTASTEIDIPDFIYKGTKEIIVSYLAGLFDADGSAKTRPAILVTSVYPEYVKQVQSLYSLLGIPTNIKTKFRKESNWKTIYNLVIVESSFKNEIKNLFESHSFKIKEIKDIKKAYYEYTYPKEWNKKLEDTDIFVPIKVLDIINNNDEEENTYDISVKDKHEFCLGNGLLVHNSAILILCDPWDRQMLQCKRWDLGVQPSYRSFANYTVATDYIDDLHPEFWKTFEVGEPFGLFHRANSKKYGRIGELRPDNCAGCNPCGEASLENGEMCNLADLMLHRLDSPEEMIAAAKLMYRYSKRVTCEKYHYNLIDEVMKRNRRVGIGITGCLKSPLFKPEILDEVYKTIQLEDELYSKELGIPKSIKTTLVKPSGTISKLTDAGGYEGIHPAYSRHFIQRIRFAANDPLIPLLEDAGHHIEPVKNSDGTVNSDTLVVDFYLSTPKEYPVADESWDTWKQLDVLKMVQKYWCDQACSVTVYYKREDIAKIKEWLYNNYNNIKSISFLCHSEHGFKQAPKEAITEQQYEELSKKVRPIDLSKLQDSSSYDIDNQECQNGVCPIK